MVKKRGQAAMEFLMTYGWALLVVLVAIGALAFFGVLNPGQFLPETCTIMPGLSCNDFKVSTAGGVPTNGQIQLVIQNGLGKDLKDINLTATDCTDSSAAAILTDGKDATFSCDFGTSPSTGRYKGGDNNLVLAYTETVAGNDIIHNVDINLLTEVQ